MKRQILVNGLLSLTAVALVTGCKDDKYDLSDIDTTSKFIVDNLTVPVRLQKIELKNVIDFDDDDPDALVKEDGGQYVLSEKGGFDATSFDIGEVRVPAPYIPEITINVTNPLQSGIQLPAVPAMTIPLGESDLKPYEFAMNDINEALKVLRDVKAKQDYPISIEISLTVPPELLGAGNTIAFKNLVLQMPKDLVVETYSGITYDPISGELSLGEIVVDASGRASFTIKATGLNLGEAKGTVHNGRLSISGEVGVLGGDLFLDLKNVTLPGVLDIKTVFDVSGFELASFSGDIEYNMEGIDSEIDLNDLPDFLDNEETNIIIANPQIIVDIENPVARYGLKGAGQIILTSIFKDGSPKRCESGVFVLEDPNSHIVFGPSNSSDTNVAFDALGYVLTNLEPGQDPNDPDYKPVGLPNKIKVEIQDIKFDGTVTDFPLGKVGEAKGDYEFKAPLGFGKGTKIIYETTEGDWGGDDMDDVNITKVMVEAKCETNLPVSVKLYIIPIDKNGEEIKVVETKEFNVPANAKGDKVVLSVEALPGHTITDFDGVKFRAIVSQDGDNTNAIGPNLYIFLDELKATVAGYYETSF